MKIQQYQPQILEQRIDRQSWQPFLEQQQQDPPTPPPATQLGQPPADPPPGQQQQQQQQPPATDPNASVDPFKEIDLDMLDDKTRAVVEAAQKQFATVAKTAADAAQQAEIARQQAQSFQSKHDSLLAQVNERNRQQAPKEPTTEDRLTEYYIKQGLTPDVAKKSAGIMAGAYDILGQGMQQEIGKQLAPIVGSTLSNQAQSAFHQVVQSDRTGAMQNQEIAQAVWESVERLTSSGQLVDADLIQNLKLVHMGKLIETGKWLPGSTPPRHQQLPPPPNLVTPPSTRFTFPGANIVVPRQQQQTDGAGDLGSLDAETAAAVAATTAVWKPQPIKIAGGRK